MIQRIKLFWALEMTGSGRMVRLITEITVFLSATSEMQDDVEKLEETIELFNNINRTGHIRFRCINWRKNSVGQVGTDPQASINQQLLSDDQFDVLFALLGSTVGSKTPREDSGVIEEIEIGRSKDGSQFGNQHVHVLFKNVQAPLLDVDVDNLIMLKTFRDRIKKDTLYYDYTTDKDLTSHILKSLQSITEQYEKRGKITPSPSEKGTPAPQGEDKKEEVSFEAGFLDYMDHFEQGMSEAAEGIQKIGEILNDLNAKLSDEHRAEIMQNPVASSGEKKKVLDEIGRDMAEAAGNLAVVATETEEKFFDALGSFRKGVVLQSEEIGFHWKEEDFAEFDRVCNETISQINNLRDTTIKGSDVLATLPRATGGFNRGKKDLLSANVNVARMASEMSSQMLEAMQVIESFRTVPGEENQRQ